MTGLPYDKSNPYSIESYAKRLINSSLRQALSDTQALQFIVKGKGSLGQLIEEYYFLYKPNNNAGPDFPEAGVELKTTPVVNDSAKLKAKERLVFNIINYEEEYKKDFINSSFWKKNNLLLLMFYLHEKESIDIDLIFKIVRLFRFPAIDLKIIKDDWDYIRNKIMAGQAHELSEGDTFYLGACTKGVNNKSFRKQPFCDVPAKQRAYSLKAKYLNVVIQKTVDGDDDLFDQTLDYQKVLQSSTVQDPLVKYSNLEGFGRLSPIVKSLTDFRDKETFEDVVIRLFIPYYGLSEKELMEQFHLKYTKAKNRYYTLAKSILKVDGDQIEEFVKADIELKTLRLEYSGYLKESMSFPQIKYKQIVKENWEDSELFQTLSSKFFLVIFKKNISGDLILEKVKFWNMPWKDVESMHSIWYDTKMKILNNSFNDFIKISDNLIGHVRPKARNANDLMETAFKTYEKKKSFWLNSNYIKGIINKVQ